MTGQQQKQCSDVLKHCQKTNKQEKKNRKKQSKQKVLVGILCFPFLSHKLKFNVHLSILIKLCGLPGNFFFIIFNNKILFLEPKIWAIDSEAIFSKIQLAGQKYQDKTTLAG